MTLRIVVYKLFFLCLLLFSNISHAGLQSNSQAINIHFESVPVRDVLKILAKFLKLNIIMSANIKGNISIHLNKIMPLDAFDLVLKANGLTKEIIANTLIIAPIAEALEKKKANLAVTSISEFDPLAVKIIKLNYAKAAEIVQILKSKNIAFLTSRGSVIDDERSNSIIINESASNISKIKMIIAKLDEPVKQIAIEARIVNLIKDNTKELGISFNLKSNQSNISSLSKAANNLEFLLTVLKDSVILNLELAALEAEGKAEIISNPHILTGNGKQAIIESGEEVPYQESIGHGVSATTFKKAVLSLKVTPRILLENKISLDLNINQDIVSNKIYNGAPVLLTKAMQTQVQICNGQTVVLGGIFKQNQEQIHNRVPLVGDLPLFGWIFNQQRTILKNEELLIFITPRII